MNRDMMKKLQQLQKEMEETQERLHMTEFEGVASGVKIIMLGTHQVIDVKIDELLLEDIEMLQDAVNIAINDAVEKVKSTTESEMGRFTSGLGIGF